MSRYTIHGTDPVTKHAVDISYGYDHMIPEAGWFIEAHARDKEDTELMNEGQVKGIAAERLIDVACNWNAVLPQEHLEKLISNTPL